MTYSSPYLFLILTNSQGCIAATQTPPVMKSEEIGDITRPSMEPVEVEDIRMTDPMAILREKGG